MHLKFLGTGSAFSMSNFQTNFMVSLKDKNLLFDCGSDIRFSLKEMNMNYKDVDAVYVSHLHADHIGGMEYLAFCSYFDPTAKTIELFGNGELLRKAWNNTLKGGLESIQGKVMSLTDYFDVTMVKPNSSFVWEGIEFCIVQTVHIMNGFAIIPSYGLIFKSDKDKCVFLTGDTQFNPNQIMDFYKMADVIVQDCETFYKSGVHAHYDELKTLDAEVKAKMLLVHYQDNVLHKGIVSEEWENKAADDGFRGFVQKGQEFEV